jgi:hypothetical protein
MRTHPVGGSGRKSIAVCALIACASWVSPAPAQVCGAGEAPDVIVSDLFEVALWGTIGEISAYSIGTYSCNLGSCPANWLPTSADHPVIAQNLFRLENGRFEQIGQSWNPHAWVALATNECGVPNQDCIPPGDGTRLGVYCSDPVTASVNGQQSFHGGAEIVGSFRASNTIRRGRHSWG